MDDYDWGRTPVRESPPPVSRDYRSGNEPYRSERRRSPDRRRERRRSRSPAPIDRYQPDRVRDDYAYSSRGRDEPSHHQRRRSSPQAIDRYVPGDRPEHTPILVNPLPDPMKLDFQVGFTWFAEWWRTEQRIKEEKERAKSGRPPPRLRGERETREDRDAERPKIQAAYDLYKENLQRSQAQTFVRLHRSEDWFRERYVPEVRDPFRQKLKDYRKGLVAQWEHDLSEGVFDEFTLEGIYKAESNGLGGIMEREEGETSAAAEVLGVGDLLPSKGGDLRDPASLQPTLLIKTIAPTVTREKFETFAREHLGEGACGFKHLSLSDPNPLKKCHRMGWIMLNPTSEEDGNGTDQQEIKDNAEVVDGAEGEAANAAAKANLSPSEKALEKINGKTIEDPERGNFTVHCGVHRPPDAPRKKALWDLFSASERIARDLELATRLVRKLDNELADEVFGVAKIEERVHELSERGLLKPEVPAKSKSDPDAMDAEIEEGEEDEDEGAIDEDESDDEELLVKKKKLDLLVEYLRRVYNFCFFCVFESDSVHELQRKCPGGHLRRPRASLTSAAKETARASASGEVFPLRKKSGGKDGDDEQDMDIKEESPVEEKKSLMKPNMKTTQQLQRAFNWVKTFEEKILQILEPDNVNLRKLGGTPLEEGVEKELVKFVLQEDVNKFRCKVPECTKLFKGVDFWRKHVEKRHADFNERVKAEVELVNTYVLDPAHIAPSRSDANSNGHFPLNNHAPSGTPRGFQLNQQFPMGFPMNAGITPGGAAGMSPMFANGQPMAMPGMWAAGAAGGVGPMRTNNRNFMQNGGYRMQGPYARNGRGRGPSMSNGRPMGMTEGGAATMGPNEAVVGRSLRSYEDLDADKGEGTGELNY
ncbi:Putative G patch domain-containing protein [Septoria linicola]|uniref:G patch domain-containing protein n=1 Tax=Septoria linicola TaxID=215465 RepID=A0A9Q9AFI0_9PEZI|nr:putative G patch domain-containing protein [Septoria linicola]USW48499.1 Putative G patch domain-containing protein [Septoria linicola]